MLPKKVLNQLACNIANLDLFPADICKVAHAIASALDEPDFEGAVNNLFVVWEDGYDDSRKARGQSGCMVGLDGFG